MLADVTEIRFERRRGRGTRRGDGALRSLVLLLLLAASTHAEGVIFTIGSEPACTHTDIQAAIDALPATGNHEIRLRAGHTYAQQALQINGRNLALVGGFADCGASAATGPNSVLDGHGGAQAPVLLAFGFPISIRLERLDIRRGDARDDARGGGVFYEGTGSLTLRRTTVSNNRAGHGGGISVRAVAGPASLVLESDSVVSNNVARHDGGGIHLWGGAGHMASLHLGQPGSVVAFNEAPQGLGGGIALIGKARAFIGSGGLTDTVPVLFGNLAQRGGGLGVGREGSLVPDVVVHLFTTDPARPVRIHDNVASDRGGGLFLENFDDGRAVLCAQDVRIDGNVAPSGSAIEATLIGLTGRSAALHFNLAGQVADCPVLAGAVACAAGSACNLVEGNLSATVDGTPTAGSTIVVGQGGRLLGRRLALRGNRGGTILGVRFGTSNDIQFNTRATLKTCLLADNETSFHLAFNEADSILELDGCTLAGNQIGASEVLDSSGRLVLARSILHQPGKASLRNDGALVGAGNVLSSEVGSLGGPSASVIQGDPRFWDAEHGDYRLHAASLATDFAAEAIGDTEPVDLDGRPRRVDLPLKPDRFGPRDLGAYERQVELPLVRNGGFGVDLRSWSVVTAGSASWEAQGVDAGSAFISQIAPPGGEVIGLRQCVPLPGPATYALNAFALAPGTGVNRDIPLLIWRYRANSPSCAGPATAEGELFLPRSASFLSAPEPASFVSSAAEWNHNATLELMLAVRDGDLVGTNAVRAQFDRVTLSPAGSGMLIFQTGFESP